MGIEQGAITNSPVDCLCDAATSVSEAIGTGVPRQIPITRSKMKALTFMVGAFIFGVFRRGNKPPVLLGEMKTSRATMKRGEASAKPQRNIGKN